MGGFFLMMMLMILFIWPNMTRLIIAFGVRISNSDGVSSAVGWVYN